MKKFTLILMMAIAGIISGNAQQKNGQNKKENRPQFTVEQRTELEVKQLTLALDLNEKQQNQIKPLLLAQATKHKATMDKMKVARENKQRPSDDELFAMKNEHLDHQIAMKKAMKEILTNEQFEKFEKMARMREMRKNKMMANHDGIKHRMPENDRKK